MSKLNQILAVEKGEKARHNKAVDEAYKTLQKPVLMSGLTRNYHPLDEENGEKLPGEHAKVQVTVDDLFKNLTNHFTKLWDITFIKDSTNCTALADIVVDGNTLAQGVPVTYLLFLEKQLTDVQTFINKMPILDPAEDWDWDANRGCYVSKETVTHRTKKVPRVLTKAPATDKHPAQVDVWQEDVVVGNWSSTKFSGAMPQDKVTALLEKVATLLTAVKYAREEANSVDVLDVKIGESLFGYLLS